MRLNDSYTTDQHFNLQSIDFMLPKRNTLPILSLPLTVVIFFISIFLNIFGGGSRQYYPEKSNTGDLYKNRIQRMEQFFFNARKNNMTNSLDYGSMLAADIADRAMSHLRRTHSATVP